MPVMARRNKRKVTRMRLKQSHGTASNDGYTMIMVMAVMSIIVALSLALLLSASVLIHTVRQAEGADQCRIYAVSLSAAMTEQIESYTYADPPGAERVTAHTGLGTRLQTVATSAWKPETLITYQHLGKEAGDDIPGETTLEFCWLDSAGSLIELSVEPGEDMAEAAAAFAGLRLYLTVTNTIGENSSTIISVFCPVVDTRIIYIEGEDEDGDGVADSREELTVWTGWRWNYMGPAWEGGENG